MICILVYEMGTTTVRIDEEILEDIKSKQQEGETLSDTIGRLTGHEGSTGALEDLVGLADESSIEEVRRCSAEFREEMNQRLGNKT
jgi:predicted CopG family antitoxin